MSIKRRARTRLVIAFVAMAAMMFALVPAGPASAGQVVGVVQGTASLSGGIGTCGTGSFSGTATGVHATTPQALAPVSASFNYCNPNYALGDASGSINLAGHACTFTWLRVGVTAVVSIRGCDTAGTAVAEFVPIAGISNDAIVVGQGVFPVQT